MKNIAPLLLLGICLFLAAIASHGATPLAVQLCPISANTFAVPTKPTDSLRTLDGSNIQGCVAYGSLTADLKLYGGSPHAWQTQAALGIGLYQPPVIPPVVTPPVVTPPVNPPTAPVSCPDTFVRVSWTCSVVGKVATCTAPISP